VDGSRQGGEDLDGRRHHVARHALGAERGRSSTPTDVPSRNDDGFDGLPEHRCATPMTAASRTAPPEQDASTSVGLIGSRRT
jgi:hypothetical protein